MDSLVITTFQTLNNQANFTNTSTQASTTFYNLKSHQTTPPSRHALATMSTFHPFTRLPTEIRLMIWEEAVPVREVYIVGRWGDMPIAENWILDPKLPPPALVHVCRESRNLGLYKKAFYRDVFRCAEEPLWFHWINFDCDVFHFSYNAVRELHGPEVEMIRHIIVKIPRSRNKDEIMTGVPKKYPRIETYRSRPPRPGEPDYEKPYVWPHGPDRS